MYNRYIPQSDGSYRRSRMPEPQREQSRPTPPPPPVVEECPPEQERPSCNNCIHNRPQRPMPPPRPRKSEPPQAIGSFLKNLLPKGFDTEDLLIVLLLLLMAGDCQEDQNTALLTLVLYLFL